MKFNKAVIISLLILAVITMGAVSAADENATAEIQSETQENPASFTDLASLVENASGGQTLYLDNDYVNDGSSEGIDITDAITLDGKNHTIDAGKASNVFNVKNANVILKNINFINAINSAVNGTCTLYDCSFKDCYSDGYGGAIQFTSAGAIYNCSFVNCSSNSLGGAVYSKVRCNAYDSSFVNCSSGSGGALRDVNANGCYFENCFATSSVGGAINNGNAYNSSFVNCHAPDNGGCIYFYEKNGNIFNCSFVNCSSGYCGGAVAYFGKMNVKYCSFENCSAKKFGGALYLAADLEGCTFKNCHSDENGGGLYSYNVISSVRNCSFDNCSAVKYGGAVYSANAYNCTMLDCSAGKYGAAIYNGNATDCSIIGWYAPGGAIYKGDAYNCTVLESPHIIISTDFAHPNDNVNVALSISKNAYGNVTVAVNGRTYTGSISSGKANVNVGRFREGNYELVASYAGNANCCAQTVTGNLVVGKTYQKINVSASEITYFGEPTLITAEMGDGATGYVHILIEGKDYKAKISDGMASLNVSGIKVGTHNFTVKYAGNYKYNAEEASSSFEVVKGTPMISISAPATTCGNDATVTVEFSEYVNGYVKIIANGKAIRTQIINSTASASFSALGAGTYDVKAIYSGNANYNAQTINTTLSVGKGNPIKSVTVKRIKVGHDAVVNVKMADNVNGFVKITLNDVTQRVQIVNGTATLSVSGLKAGSYSATVTYAGNKNFKAQTKTAYFSVTKSTPRIQVAKAYYETQKITEIMIHINSDATGYLRVTFNGTLYRLAIDSMGNTYIQVDGRLNRFTVDVSYAGNYKYTAVNETINFPNS